MSARPGRPKLDADQELRVLRCEYCHTRFPFRRKAPRSGPTVPRFCSRAHKEEARKRRRRRRRIQLGLFNQHVDIVTIAYAVDLRSHQRRRAERDDFLQAGYEGLLRAAMNYRPGRGSFRNYAFRCVRFRMLEVAGLTRKQGWKYEVPIGVVRGTWETRII